VPCLPTCLVPGPPFACLPSGNHTTGECWLKVQEKWDNNVDMTKSNLMVNHRVSKRLGFLKEDQLAKV